MLFTKRSHTLKKYISHTLLGTISFVFLISFITGILIERNSAKLERIKKIQDIHTTLIPIIAPELSVYNTMEIRKLLSLASSSGKIFSVIDNNKNIYMTDYAHFDTINKLLSKVNRIDCQLLAEKSKNLYRDRFFYCSQIYYYNQRTGNNTNLGVLVSYSTIDAAFHSWKLLIESLVAFLGIASLLFILLKQNLHKKLLSPLIKLEGQISKLGCTHFPLNTNIGDIGWAPIEIHKIKKSFDQLLNCLYIENMKIRENEKKATLSHLAVQIAHDIRSPLAALEVIVVEARKFPEKKRLLIRHSINRINDIANNLLTQYRLINKSNKEESENHLKSELLSALINMIISEKRLQLNRSNIKICFEIDEMAHGTCANINRSLFDRTLSNILNNSIEAISERGEIKVGLETSIISSIIKITDNGCGIPEHLLPILLNDGASYGKENGSGLGLPSAIYHIKSWNGTFQIESKINQGTVITICLPLAKSPSWFAENLFFSKNIKHVVIVDDEESVHQIWDNRFENIAAILGFELLHFKKPIELISWYKQNSNLSALFLIDYQFEDYKISGIDLIRQCGIESSATLVTSNFESENLRDECLRVGVKLLPKFFAAYIPIEITEDLKVDLVFLDDDYLITDTWRLACELRNIKIKIFNDVHLFMKEIIHYSKLTPIYMDSDLGNNINGEELTKDLYMIGYRELYLVTGKPKDNFSEAYWIKAVNNKNCPYLN